MDTERPQLELLALTGRLLLENDESTGEIHRALTTAARSLTNAVCDVTVFYGGLAVSLAGEGPLVVPVRELRFNMTVQAAVHSILDQVRQGKLNADTALTQLKRVTEDAPRHPRWVVILLLGGAAASLALLLGADAGAALIAGLATGLGLAARQELGRRHFSLLTLPFVGALIGAMLGGIAIRLGWTRTPGLALIVPSLVLVPGPHFINGLLDLVDNYLPMSISRLTLAMSIVAAAALGVILGVVITLGAFPAAEQISAPDRLNLFSDMALAGIVTCGFAAAYNTMWAHVAMAAVGGMAGHGLRFLALESGWNLDLATFLGGIGVGLVSALIARSTRIPVAVIAYAGAVTMMPGLPIYRALGGAFRLGRLDGAADMPTIASTLGHALHACLVVGALRARTCGRSTVSASIYGRSRVMSITGRWITPGCPRHLQNRHSS